MSPLFISPSPSPSLLSLGRPGNSYLIITDQQLPWGTFQNDSFDVSRRDSSAESRSGRGRVVAIPTEAKPWVSFPEVFMGETSLLGSSSFLTPNLIPILRVPPPPPLAACLQSACFSKSKRMGLAQLPSTKPQPWAMSVPLPPIVAMGVELGEPSVAPTLNFVAAPPAPSHLL